MRIGLFTDTYRPSVSGVVMVVESAKRHLEALGHTVYVFCPASSIRPGKHAEAFDEDESIIRFPSVKGAFYDDYDTSLFFPPRVLGRIRELELDVIHFFTPGQVGIMGVYAAHKTGAALVAQHCTDLYEFAAHYPNVLPGLLAMLALLPFTARLDGKDIRELMRLYRPRRGRTDWTRDIIERAVTLVYKRCDAVIALSRKSQHQLESWQRHEDDFYPVTLLPSGVDAIPAPTSARLAAFREQWGLSNDNVVVGYVGRIASEKNLPLLLEAFSLAAARRPQLRLMYVGDFDFREELERLAAASPYPERVIFTGRIERQLLGAAFAAFDIFAFPSLTDTQGWVVHEAAHAGRPIILIDRELSEVVEADVNGLFAENDADSLANVIGQLADNPARRHTLGAAGTKLARRFTERNQTKKLVALYEKAIVNQVSKQFVDSL